MNYFEEIKDHNGKTYLSLQKSLCSIKNTMISNNLDDYEIIQLIGESQLGKIYKVISKTNKKVYAMKITNLSSLKSENLSSYNLVINESIYLTYLNHPHIIKYYTNFMKGDNLYSITDNISNSDLASYIEAHKLIKTHFEEDELWSIFLQCIQGLEYIHSNGVIHRNIRSENILIDNNKIIKLGYYGINNNNINNNMKYLNANYQQKLNNNIFINYNQNQDINSKEKLEYDQKIDVYYMGIIFYEMCFFQKNNEYKNMKNSCKYSNEILNIINEMMEKDNNKRKNSEYFLKKIKEEFSKKYNRNTSIDSIIRCLYSFDKITNYYLNLNINLIQNKPVLDAFIKCLKNFTSINMLDYLISIKCFREKLCEENSKFDKVEEIEPKLLMPFIIKKIYDNEIIFNNLSNNEENSSHMIQREEMLKTFKEEMLINFKKYYSQINSFISEQFLGLIKKIDICLECKIKTYSFIGYFFVTLDLEDIAKYVKPIDIENYFNYQNKIFTTVKKYCIECLSTTKQKEYKQFYTAPDYLIAIINRGINNYNRIPVRLKQIINLENLVEKKGKKYNLVGFINKNYETENYFSFFVFKDFNKWYKCESFNINEYEPQNHNDMFDDNGGNLMMAFYEVIN